MNNREIPLNFENYPYLWMLFEDDQQEFSTLVKGMLRQLNKVVEHQNHIKVKEHFNMDYVTLVSELFNAFYDYKAIIKNHPNAGEAKSLEILEHENNPMSIITGNALAYRADGSEQLSISEFTGLDKVNFKQWFQGLLYAARYVSHKDLAQYLYLKEYDLIDMMKAQNVQKLIEIQPALKYQKEKNITLGRLIPGTGFFDCGELEPGEHCKVCQSKSIVKQSEYVACLDCKGAVHA